MVCIHTVVAIKLNGVSTPTLQSPGVTEVSGNVCVPVIVVLQAGVTGGGVTVTVFVQAGLVIFQLIVQRGANVPPATYLHDAVEVRFTVPLPQSIR